MINTIFPRLFQIGLWPSFARGLISVIGLALLASILFAQSAFAADGRRAVTHKVQFNQTDIDPLRTLDWRSPAAALTFDIPDNDWVDDIELLLSARPQGQVSANTPLLVRFNDADPIPLNTDGHGFDARITLDPMNMRGQRNQVTLEYQIPENEACLGPHHGAWDLDIKDSVIVVKSRGKLQALDFHDIHSQLTAPATKPNSVAILTRGANKTNLEALAAQGISRNLENIPNFRLGAASADIVIVAARRDQLGRWVRDPAIRRARGAQIAVADSFPVKLVLTGDTDEDVLNAAKAFSSSNIPDSRARSLSPVRFNSLAENFAAPARAAGVLSLTSLGAVPFTAGWAPRPQHLLFDVADPAGSSGKLNLHLQLGPFVDPSSRLDVSLNGQMLDSIALVKSKQKAKIDIPKGLLQGLDNQLVLTPRLSPSTQQPTCAATRIGPGLGLGVKSALTIRRDSFSDAADLSVFAASGAPFSDRQDIPSTVLISTNSKAERAAALRVLSQLSRASRRGWADAKILDAKKAEWPSQGHVLVIGSNVDLPEPALSNAPRSLKVALTGIQVQNPIIRKSASNITAQHNLLAARQSISGGVAALYRDGENRVIGVITQTKRQSFPKAMNDLLSGDHWSSLEGSVARWDSSKVSMAQTALAPKSLGKKTTPIFENLKFPRAEKLQMSASEKWAGFVTSIKDSWNRQGGYAALPPEIKPMSRGEMLPTRTGIPVPRLKPSFVNSQPMKVSSGMAVPKAPREDIFPKIDAWVSGIGSKIGTGYGGLSQQLSGAVKATPIGENPANAGATPRLLVFALGVIFLLILTVFISPGKDRVKNG